MPDLPLEAIVFSAIALYLGFLTGRQDSANVVALVISTRALSPRRTLVMAAIGESIGPFLFGVAVAQTIGNEVVAQRAMTLNVVYAALLASIVWNIATIALGIPSSTSHALVGGLLGPALAGYGLQAVQLEGLLKVVLALFVSPIVGLIAGYYMVKLSYFLARGATPRANIWFKRGELVTAFSLALAHGGNDAQKTMGIITLGLVSTGALSTFHVPFWVVVSSAAAIALGTLFGGWRIIRTLGARFYRVRPVHGFGAQAAASAVITAAAILGGPVSTTHVISSAIVGAGSADRVKMVRWGVVSNIVMSWFLTIPISAALGAVLYLIVQAINPGG